MEFSATILWKGQEVGRILNARQDMWYLGGEWQPACSAHALAFVDVARKLEAKEVMASWEKGLVVFLTMESSDSVPQPFLLTLLEGADICMRLLSEEMAAYIDLSLVAPWRRVDNPAFYEEELRKEVSFFHPLKRKNVKAIGVREDCDDVLFEVLNGISRFAVVHLTYSRERSRKFPATQFFKDWADLYKSRLVGDHKVWNTV